MANLFEDQLMNNKIRDLEIKKDISYNNITRLASPEQRSTAYRMSGMLNFGAKQMVSMAGELDFYVFGVGGSPIVG